ncbi:hypothetical protein PHISCL_02828 [Aspergillus sclerotialis]|uniref:NADH dehydrogenase [ubiquinone] 1 alpha subcomplex subunit 1 n=1 Tax=Aspergillus sclerotialis TaxID=2070753 RepID=A0A3A2ZNJ6_9EURO|nr:hypothetical protein PHISCL_02828 [Aspergillus sclerotialis]
MPVPFEALIPYGIIVACFGVTGVGLHYVKTFANDGKRARWNTDLWDRADHVPTVTNANDNLLDTVMERDMRLTGSKRGQSTNAIAPKGFEVSNPWKLEKRIV